MGEAGTRPTAMSLLVIAEEIRMDDAHAALNVQQHPEADQFPPTTHTMTRAGTKASSRKTPSRS
jgi:hypothetical protein